MTDYWPTFARMLGTIDTGEHFTVDRLRDQIEAAQIPRNAVGVLFRTACQRGLLTTAGLCRPSREASRKGALVRVYWRTGKNAREAA